MCPRKGNINRPYQYKCGVAFQTFSEKRENRTEIDTLLESNSTDDDMWFEHNKSDIFV